MRCLIRQILHSAQWQAAACNNSKKIIIRGLASQAEAASKPSYFHYMGKEPLVFSTIGRQLEKNAINFGGTEAIVSFHENRRLTYRGLLEEVDRLAAGLLKLGLQQGSHVGIWGPNNFNWYVSMMAVARAGLVSVGINPGFQGPELEYCLKKVGIKALITWETYKTQNYYDILCSICPELTNSNDGKVISDKFPQLQHVIIDSATQFKGALKLNDVLNMVNMDEIKNIAKLQAQVQPDAACNIQFTSGTTGFPKAAVLSHYNFVNNGLFLGARNQLKWQRMCVQVPLFHAYGVVVIVMSALMHSSTLVLPSQGFNAEASLRAAVAENCSAICGTPTMYVDLIAKQRQLQLTLPTKMAVIGGAICTPQLLVDMLEELGVQEIRNVYGLTEATAAVFQTVGSDDTHRLLNTVGHVQDHLEVKVIDAQGNTVPFGQPGELCVRGYSTMLRYHDDEAKTKQVLGEDKWLKTGDQFILQADGYGRIVGRLKELIIRGGENIYPKEIEDFLNTHANIAEAFLVGVPDKRLGEEICAFVRLKNADESINREAIVQFCKGKLAHFKIPRYVVTMREFPKTTSGKIQKFKLQEWFNANIQRNGDIESRIYA